MSELRRNLEAISYLQNRKRPIHEEKVTNKEITIHMSKSTFFFVVLMQVIIVSLFFILGFIVAWNYFAQTTPASFAKPKSTHNSQIIQDIDTLNHGSSSQ